MDFERGEELATNLSELYDYCVRRLLKANIRNDVEGIQEVKSLMSEIKDAWSLVPQLLDRDVNVSLAS